MHQPFVDASTAALDALRHLKIEGMRDPAAEVDMRFHASDPAVHHRSDRGVESVPKLDVFILPSEATRDFHRGDGKAAKGSDDPELPEWQDMLGVVEFKRRLGGCMDTPPEKYDVLDYEPTISESLTSPDESDTDAVGLTVGSLNVPPSDQIGTSEQVQSE